MKDRNPALDFTRVCAMLAVILIHVTSGYIWLPSSRTILDMNLAFILNQASRFSVPLFLLLSGVSLSLYQGQILFDCPPAHKPATCRKSASSSPILSGLFPFYRRRFGKLLPPYWFWSTVYFLFGRKWDVSSLWSPFYVRCLVLGFAGPHLYFIVILAQCYLLYPLFRQWRQRSVGAFLLVWSLALYGTTQLIMFRKLGLSLLPAHIWPYVGISLPLWGFCFALGTAVTPARLARLRQWASVSPLLFPSIWVAAGFLCVLEARAAGYLDTDRLSLFLYACLSFPALLSLWTPLENRSVIRWAVRFLAKHSMTIYYCHVLLLTLFRRRWPFIGTFGFLRLYAAVVLSSAAVSAALDAVPAIFRRYAVPVCPKP